MNRLGVSAPISCGTEHLIPPLVLDCLRSQSISPGTALLPTRRGAASDDFRIDDDRGGRGRALDDLGHEQLRALAAGLEEVLADGGEPHEVTRLDVVIADHGEVVRDVEAQVLCGREHAKSLRVAGGEDGGRTI